LDLNNLSYAQLGPNCLAFCCVRSKNCSVIIITTQKAIQTRVNSEAHNFICNLFSMNVMKVVENLEVDRGGC
jgi:hypothetical protein